MPFCIFFHKARKRLWYIIVNRTKKSRFYPLLYLSFWHYLLTRNKSLDTLSLYYSARPNSGAGIGHQMANWIAGYWYAQRFGLRFAHIPFSSNKWEEFLGFGYGEISAQKLKLKGFKTRLLPLFEDGNQEGFEVNKKIIQSYAGKKVVFIAEQDQFYAQQYGVMDTLKEKFFNAPSRKEDKILYDKENFNIAIHVRRGDILANPNNSNLAMRYLANDYYFMVLKQVLSAIHSQKPVHIYIFSQGTKNDFPEFAKFENLHWCLDMSAQESFSHMIYADILITSKSSFSYKPALISNGIKICPRNFWHGYPQRNDWILCEDNGIIPEKEINKLHHLSIGN